MRLKVITTEQRRKKNPLLSSAKERIGCNWTRVHHITWDMRVIAVITMRNVKCIDRNHKCRSISTFCFYLFTFIYTAESITRLLIINVHIVVSLLWFTIVSNRFIKKSSLAYCVSYVTHLLQLKKRTFPENKFERLWWFFIRVYKFEYLNSLKFYNINFKI